MTPISLNTLFFPELDCVLVTGSDQTLVQTIMKAWKKSQSSRRRLLYLAPVRLFCPLAPFLVLMVKVCGNVMQIRCRSRFTQHVWTQLLPLTFNLV